MKQTLQSLLTFGRNELTRRGVPDPELDAKYLLLEAFRTDMVHFLMNRSRPLPEEEEIGEGIRRYREMIGLRGKRIPLQQILGTQEFMGLSFYVNRHVLIPRQDTETLAELVLREHPGEGEHILDLCTGSGCIAISLARLGNFRRITAADLSAEALKVAERNREGLLGGLDEEGKVSCQVELLQGDLFLALEPTEEVLGEGWDGFDVLVSNPPYIPTCDIPGLEAEVKDYEPRMALDGSGDGLEFYRRIARDGGRYLKHGAAVYLEIGYDQGEKVKQILQEHGFCDVRIIPDAAGHDRVAAAGWP